MSSFRGLIEDSQLIAVVAVRRFVELERLDNSHPFLRFAELVVLESVKGRLRPGVVIKAACQRVEGDPFPAFNDALPVLFFGKALAVGGEEYWTPVSESHVFEEQGPIGVLRVAPQNAKKLIELLRAYLKIQKEPNELRRHRLVLNWLVRNAALEELHSSIALELTLPVRAGADRSVLDQLSSQQKHALIVSVVSCARLSSGSIDLAGLLARVKDHSLLCRLRQELSDNGSLSDAQIARLLLAYSECAGTAAARSQVQGLLESSSSLLRENVKRYLRESSDCP